MATAIRRSTRSLDFLAFFHEPHYVLAEAAPLVQVRTEPGRAPVPPTIDDDSQRQYVYMVRDLGARRQPAMVLTIGGGAIFLALCYLLHRREKFLRANLAMPTTPVVAPRRGSANQPSRAREGNRFGLIMGQYLPIVVLMILAVLFGAVSYGASRLLAPSRPSSAKEAPYECGIVPSREPPERFPVGFYVVAMLFIMFDIEIVFIYPYAVSHTDARRLRVLGRVRVLGGLLRHVRVRGCTRWARLGPDRHGAQPAPPMRRWSRSDRTLTSTVRRVGTEGRLPVDEEAA